MVRCGGVWWGVGWDRITSPASSKPMWHSDRTASTCQIAPVFLQSTSVMMDARQDFMPESGGSISQPGI